MVSIFRWADEIPTDPDTGALAPAVYNRPRSITASAKRVSLKNSADIEKLTFRSKRVKWQADAWDYYDLIGEIKFAANLVSNVLSRINLYVGYVENTAQVPAHIRNSSASEYSEISEAVLQLLESNDDGTAGLLRMASLNLFIAGEYYLVKIPGNAFTKEPEKWEVHSVDEVVVEGTGDKADVYIRSAPDEDRKFWIKLPRDGYICRMWRKHPRYTSEADSSLKGVLDDCDDLLLYTRESRSVSKSRVASGILYIPSEISETSVPNSDADESSDGTDSNEPDLVDELADALIEPIGDDASIYSSVPYVLQGPADYADKIRYISLNRSIDPMYQQNIEFKLERILSSLDIPKDIAKGMSSVKYSNGVLIEESLYKSHIEPLILMITDIFTSGFLRPALIGNGVPEEIANKIVIWYDPSAITAKPSKSEAANFGITNQLISDSAWRSANGFSDSEGPSEVQTARDFLRSKLVLNDPQIVTQLLERALPELMADTRKNSLSNSDESSAGALNEVLGMTPEGVEYVSDDPAAEAATPAPAQEATGLIEP